MTINIKITGTGCLIPDEVVPNSLFESNRFYGKDGSPLEKPTSEIIAKLESITGIRERRYLPRGEDSIGIMTKASRFALEDAAIDADQLSGIIVAHNAGNMITEAAAFHTVPNMASYLKNSIGCRDHECVAYDILFGCPGWLQGMIQANNAVLSERAGHYLVVGLEVASRMLDPHDVDSMILGDGCGACVVSPNNDPNSGILSSAAFSHAADDNRIIYLGPSNNPDLDGHCYFHMNGREVYRYATEWVPKVIDAALERAGLNISDIDIFLFHQANAKMLEAIAANICKAHRLAPDALVGRIPTTIEVLGNTSVATIPTMIDLIRKGKLGDHEIREGHTAVMASVGAGMHCNAIVYRF